MRRSIPTIALVLAFAAPVFFSGEIRADDKPQVKRKPTRESVAALKQRLEKARDAMRALAASPAPKGLSVEQRKVFAAQMQKVAALARGTDGVAKQIGARLADGKGDHDIDAMSEMGEMESLRLQMAMDRLSKMMSTLSNLLKKTSDTASSITQNLK